MRGDTSAHEPEDPQGIDPLGLWQSQTKEYDAMTLADIHTMARRLDGRVQRRNAVEYVACGVVIVGFAQTLLNGPNWIMRAGAGLFMLAVPYVAWQLHRRGSAEGVVQPGESAVDAYRRHLSRQRDALKSVGSWYLAPFAPGMALMTIGMWFRTPRPGLSVAHDHLNVAIGAVVIAALFLGIWWLNRRGARLLQKRIDEL
jgi:hypothetical protein